MPCTIFFFLSILRNVAKPRALIWITLEVDLWQYEAPRRWFQEAPVAKGKSEGENVGYINQMITVRSPWMNLTKKLWMMLWVTLKAVLPPQPKIWEYEVIFL